MPEIGFPALRYDITMPLCDGRVTIEGVELKPQRTTSMVFRDVPELREGRFGVADLNLGYLSAAIDAGWELAALPVFSKRKPAYQFIFCRKQAGIETPRDLEGKRVGARQYRTALGVWARGLLQDHHGVDYRRIRWIAQVPEVFPNHDTETEIEYVDETPGIVDRFLAGEMDALMTDISDAALFDRLENDPGIHRLFPDYAAEDEALFRKTGIYTPVHVIVMSRPLISKYPDLPRKLFDAFEQAKRIAYDDALSDRAGFSVAYQRDILKAQQEKFGDLWAYGIGANRPAIDAYLRYSADQGITRNMLAMERVFAGGTLDT